MAMKVAMNPRPPHSNCWVSATSGRPIPPTLPPVTLRTTGPKNWCRPRDLPYLPWRAIPLTRTGSSQSRKTIIRPSWNRKLVLTSCLPTALWTSARSACTCSRESGRGRLGHRSAEAGTPSAHLALVNNSHHWSKLLAGLWSLWHYPTLQVFTRTVLHNSYNTPHLMMGHVSRKLFKNVSC